MSPTFFNIYISDILLLPKDMQVTTYADNIIITASHTNHRKAQQLILLYLSKIYEWASTNNLYISTEKTITTLFTPDPAEYSTTLSLTGYRQSPWTNFKIKFNGCLNMYMQ